MAATSHAAMATVMDAIEVAATAFERAALALGHGTETYDDEAAFLILETLKLSPDDIDRFADRPLSPSEQQSVQKVIDARITTRKPASYLVQRAYIQGIPFYVDDRVIVPRSFIAELLLGDGLIGSPAFIPDPDAVTRALDLCTGSGCLAIIAAMLFANATVDAVDLSPDALDVAHINVSNHDLAARITLRESDLFAAIPQTRYDLIISNPPYVDAEAMAGLPDEYRYEPALALAGGDDGLDLVRRIVEQAPQWLTPNGALICEIGTGRERLEHAYPHLNFFWLETATSSGEVFWLSAKDFDIH